MALLNQLISNEKADRKPAGFTVTMVHYSKLIPSEANNYSTEKIQELASMILLSGGIKQNLLARKKTPDTYELIAGHRRRLAVKYLVEELGREEFAMMPVHVERTGDLVSEVNLILTNCGARERSDWEKMMEVTRLTELMKAMQGGDNDERERFRSLFGKEPDLGGRELRKLVAETLGLSETKVAQLNHIDNSLAPELKERFREGNLKVSAANKAASLPPERQKELAVKQEISMSDVDERCVSESDTEIDLESVSDSDTGTADEKAMAQSDMEQSSDPELDEEYVVPTDLELAKIVYESKKRLLEMSLGTPGITGDVEPIRKIKIMVAALADYIKKLEAE